MAKIKVLSVTSEIFPLIKTGGLADVAGALPLALGRLDVEMRTLVPCYPAIREKLKKAVLEHEFADFYGGKARLLSATFNDLPLLLLEAPHLYDRPGNPYVMADGQNWPDNAARFAALARAGASIGQGLLAGFKPDIVHAHDWQAGLVPAFLHYDARPAPKTVMTVHNLAFQGQFGPEWLARIGLPPQAWHTDGVEYYGTIGYLKAGLRFADKITTVSPTYAVEIRSPAAGMGLDGLINARAGDLVGIINGIDTRVWDPGSDDALESTFDSDHFGARWANRKALQERMGLDQDPDALLCGIVTRLSWQKGLDLLLEAIPALMRLGGQLVLLGAGDANLESGFRAAAATYPGRIACEFGYDERLAHQIQAGSDSILVPSRFEPCGLTQLCALRYGAVPIVARVGGLADTVIDANEMALANGVATGIQFFPVAREPLIEALTRAARLFAVPDDWQLMQTNGMNTDVSWSGPARRYADLYRSLLGRAA
ncbi:MAG TPA: glycogen synthase GlgA [Beijerinckiaceae bacterium]|nr:glycogen synthase GlgA [Beijerinckiaceae bacterium]